MNTFYEHSTWNPLLTAKIFNGAIARCLAVLHGGDRPRLQRLLGIIVAPQVGSIFNEAVRDNTAKRWNGVVARRTTQSDATHHRRYQVTRKSLDVAGCAGKPLLVIARHRVFLCILHCCMAFGRLFVAFLEAKVGNYPPKVVGHVQKILYRNRCGVRFPSAVEREAMVVQQVGEWSFLAFDLPLLHYNTPHTGPQAPSIQAPSATQLYYSLSIHGCHRAEEAAGGELEGDARPGVMLSVSCCSRSYCVHHSAFIKLQLPSEMNCEPIYERRNYEPVLSTIYERLLPRP